MEKVLPEKDIINFRFLTTETNLKQFLYTTFSPHVLQKEELLTKIYLYSEFTMERGTHLKSVKITLNIFAVDITYPQWLLFSL